MIATQQKIYTFTEYLNYQDSTDNKYELFNGELISMPPASGFHALILAFLYDYLIAEIKRLNLTWKVMPATVGIRTDKAKSRIPDLMILTAEQCQEIRNMTTAVIEFDYDYPLRNPTTLPTTKNRTTKGQLCLLCS